MMGSLPTKSGEQTQTSTLFQAIRRDDFKLAQTLIKSGVELDCRNYIGGTPLIEACRNRRRSKNEKERERFAKYLLDNGCDINKCDIYGRTALVYAEKNQHHAIVRILERKEYKMSLYENRIDPIFIFSQVEEEEEPGYEESLDYQSKHSIAKSLYIGTC